MASGCSGPSGGAVSAGEIFGGAAFFAGTAFFGAAVFLAGTDFLTAEVFFAGTAFPSAAARVTALPPALVVGAAFLLVFSAVFFGTALALPESGWGTGGTAGSGGAITVRGVATTGVAGAAATEAPLPL
ncbi:MAG: hypothetical protein M3R66_09445 [Actinomycetota bacterium]|nr:hypothetical protein [Actinomycetota bacterium]